MAPSILTTIEEQQGLGLGEIMGYTKFWEGERRVFLYQWGLREGEEQRKREREQRQAGMERHCCTTVLAYNTILHFTH